MAKKTYRVRVSGWSNARTVIEHDGKVMLEIALSHNHCSTCADRVRHVTAALSRRNVQYSWAYPPEGSGSFIAVDAPGRGQSVEQYLSDLLDLNIYRLAVDGTRSPRTVASISEARLVPQDRLARRGKNDGRDNVELTA